MAAVTTDEFIKTTVRADALPFSLIEQKGLMSRLGEELARAANEFSNDPSGFIRDIFLSGTKDAKRRRRIYLGIACAIVAHIAFIAVIVIAGWHQSGERDLNSTPLEVIEMLPSGATPPAPTAPKEQPKGENGTGGGGGKNDPRPASGGVVPQMASLPPMVHPTSPKNANPPLPVPPTIVGPETASLPPDTQYGLPDAKFDAPPSPGPGDGGGMGPGNGQGVGPGKRGGSGPGSGGGPGNNRTAGNPNGPDFVPSEIPFNLTKPSGFSQFTWIYRPTPVVTPEAQANKSSGTVLLRATFQANGTITDIEIINPIPFMTESAIDALQHSKFRPAAIDGRPITLTRVPVRINVHYR